MKRLMEKCATVGDLQNLMSRIVAEKAQRRAKYRRQANRVANGRKRQQVLLAVKREELLAGGSRPAGGAGLGNLDPDFAGVFF